MDDPYVEALRTFALRNGRNRWRDRLRLAWYNGNYSKWGSAGPEPGLLQSLRNHPEYGPGSGFIEKFKPRAAPK